MYLSIKNFLKSRKFSIELDVTSTDTNYSP